MALIQCPDCEGKVSSRAAACPQCAYPIQNLTNLHHAVIHNDYAMLKDLVRAGFNIEETNQDGLTPLKLAMQTGNDEAVKILVDAGAEFGGSEQKPFTQMAPVPVPVGRRKRRKKAVPPPVIASERQENQEELGKNLSAEQEPELSPEQPPELPVQKSKQPIRFIDDLAPEVENEKYTGPGLICRTCKAQIAAEDIWCASCKAPIFRRYCGGCTKLIPANAARCPYCLSSKEHRFRYIRNLEQIVAGLVIIGLLFFVFGVYSPESSGSYAEKLAEKRSEQEEQKEIAVEKSSKKMKEQRAKNARKSEKRPVVVSKVEPPEVLQAKEEPKAQLQAGTPVGAEKPKESTAENRNEKSKPEDKKEEPAVVVAKNDTEEQEAPEREKKIAKKEEPKPAEIAESLKPERAESQNPEGSVEIASQLNAKGFRLMKRGQYAEAVPVLAEAVRRFPPGKKNLTYGYALYNLGRSLRLVGRPDLAIPILEERMKIPDQRHIVARELDQAREDLDDNARLENIAFD
jgi:predicted amidophosphoribosyltransferase